MITRTFSVTDDSGFLAIIDPDAYSGFVSADWELSDILAKFAEQMASRALLIWGTGTENTWSVSVGAPGAPEQFFRACEGSIIASRGRLLLTNYESLSMAAQFADVVLPEPHQRGLVVEVEPGAYRCHIAQLRDPEAPPASGADFALGLEASSDMLPAWRAIPWSQR